MGRIYISPSDQWSNMGTNGHSEAEHCIKIANEMSKILSMFGEEVLVGDSQTECTYTERVAESNYFNADVHFCIHTNASNGQARGSMVMTYPDSVNHPIITSVNRRLENLTPTSDFGIIGRDDLYEITNTNALCVYIEVDFHDNPQGEEFIDNNIYKIAEQISYGYIEGVGRGGEINGITIPESNELWIVQAGAYSQIEYANTLLGTLFSSGIDSFVFEEGGLYKVQCGAFSKQENAERKAEEIRNKGYSCFVRRK